MDQTFDAAAIQQEPPSAERDTRLAKAVDRMADLQADALASLDLLVQRAEELHLGREAVAGLREQRAELALQLQRTLAEVERLTLNPGT
jgi:hypothetical protein